MLGAPMAGTTGEPPGRHGEAGGCCSFEDSCVELARLKMARAAAGEAHASGSHSSSQKLAEELWHIGCAFDGAAIDAGHDHSTLRVLGELWEEADEALVMALVQEASATGAQPASGGSHHRLPRCVVGECPSADAEMQAALAELRAKPGWAQPWPLEEDAATPCIGSTTSPAAAPRQAKRPVASPQQRAMPRPEVAGPERAIILEADTPPVPAAPPAAAAAPQPGGAGSFRAASEMLPPRRPNQADEAPARGTATSKGSGKASTFDEVSRSIVQGSRKRSEGTADGGGRRALHAGGGDTDGTSHEDWSEEWLRIAEPEQLARIVPALEATIQRAGAKDAPGRQDIAGLEFVKSQIEEVLIMPRLHPQLFASVLTRPARGLLLFGPPGTGKTMLARWIAAQCEATFFNINASSVLSKWIGEAERTVKALFQLASDRQPSVIFIDEIDSLLSRRRDADNESSRRVKNEFLTSLEGADTASEEKILLVGATNMPWELDPAALRRLPKRLYVPLPGRKARAALLQRQLTAHNRASGLAGALSRQEMTSIVERTDGFAGSDLQALLREAAMGPVREAQLAITGGGARKRPAPAAAGERGPSKLRDITTQDFECALRRVKPSFRPEEAERHREFNEEHGTCRGEDAMRDSDSGACSENEGCGGNAEPTCQLLGRGGS